MGEDGVGEHTGVTVLSKNAVAHHFEADVPGYRGWEWNVVLACAEGSRFVTVNEVALMAGRDALQAPDWVPYEDRVQPGDLQPGLYIPPRADDERLEETDRGHTLTKIGFQGALKRWQDAYGPTTESAELSPLKCETCAFYVQVDQIGKFFGVCFNEFADDGHIVHASYGCGAHSETPPAKNLAAQEHTPFDDERF
ncbi:DUF3027 domain-containing protein [Corynebacterium hindlerae]|uniref:DUF3027 domain-containing protein n=2 Tax=Corynebacterium hindlerae TaxID=699041 RepID=A0A7G5FIJ8_9CORY|nr:DUF3027 domain-containing protein [Corynebacterium hindlerae]QTH60764.1 DUF3027 domain-containing protein [Corynebacterium hindlerae]